MDLPVAVRERRGLPGKGDHAFLAEQIKRILVPIQYLFSTFIVTRKNPFQISFADGIFALQPMFSYGQRSKCADLLNSYEF